MAHDFASLIPDLLAQQSDSSNDAAIASDDSSQTTVNPYLVAQMNQESGGQDYDKSGNVLTSPKGAKGKMQVLDSTNLDPGYGVTPARDNSLEERARVGRDYSNALIQHYGDPTVGLAAYNWGPGNVDKWLKNGGDPNKLPEETKNYIKNITSASAGGANKQYASADTGIQTDAQYDNGVPLKDPNQMTEAELDAELAAHQQSAGLKDPSQMTEEELDAELTAHQQWLPGLRDGEKMQPSIASPNDLMLAGTTKDDKSQADVNKIIENMNAGKISKTGAALEIYGKGFGQNVRHNVTEPISNAIPQSWKDNVGNAAGFIANTYDPNAIIRGGIGSGIKQAVDYGNEKAPVTMGEAGALGSIAGNIAQVGGLGKALEVPVDLVANGTTKLPGALGRFAANEDAANTGKVIGGVKKILPSSEPEFDHMATHSAISDAYGAAKKGTQPYYNLLNEVAAGQNADASGLKPMLQSMIEDIQNTPFHEAQSELPYLKKQLAKIGDDGTMPLNDMVKLKQSLNTNFNPKRFAQGTDTPYAAVSNVVDNSLNDAAKRIPEFGEAKALADKNWLNTVRVPFEDNKVLQKFWKPEDYHAGQGVASGMMEELPDATKLRAAQMLKNIRTPEQLNAVRRALPQDLSDALSQAKIQHVIENEGAGRLASAGRAVAGVPKIAISPLKGTGAVLTDLGRVIRPDLTPEGKALITAAKVPKPNLSNKYAQPFQNLKTKLQQEKDLAAEMQPMSYAPREPEPPIPKQITYQPDVIVNSSGVAKPALPKEQVKAESARQRANTLGLTPDVRRAQVKKAMGDIWDKLDADEQSQIQNQVEEMWQERKIPIKDMLSAARQSAEELAAAKEEHSLPAIAQAIKDAGFKKGGLVAPKFTHRQWVGYLQSHGKKAGHVLKDKNDDKAQKKAYSLTSEAHANVLKSKLGRDATVREVEMAHYVTPHGVVRLLKQKNGTMPAHKMFPQEIVKDQRNVFFNGRKPYLVGQLKKVLAQGQERNIYILLSLPHLTSWQSPA